MPTRKSGSTRRSFMTKTALSAATLPMIVPSSVFGRQNAAPSERIRLGFIGMGKMNLLGGR